MLVRLAVLPTDTPPAVQLYVNAPVPPDAERPVRLPLDEPQVELSGTTVPVITGFGLMVMTKDCELPTHPLFVAVAVNCGVGVTVKVNGADCAVQVPTVASTE